MKESFFYVVNSTYFSADGNRLAPDYSYTEDVVYNPDRDKATREFEGLLCFTGFTLQNEELYCIHGYLKKLASYSLTHRRRWNFVCYCFGKGIYSLCYSRDELETLKRKSAYSALHSFSDSINLLYDIYDKRAKEKSIPDMFLFGEGT